ncbi:MAG: type ISP restriction/modification enzyme [Phycisphaerae bacterium]
MHQAIKRYLQSIRRTHGRGHATEHSYRPALMELVESFASGLEVTNEPRRVRCGAPDLIVARGGLPFGFIECKDVTVSLDEAEQTEQLARYRDGLDHLILTDYLEFRYYVRGEQQMHAVVGRIDASGKVKALTGGDEQLAAMFDAFLAAEPVKIAAAGELAARMADIAKIINHAIRGAFEQEQEPTGTLHGEYEAFRQTLLRDLTVEQFADMYAQTVCYGMFSARVNVPDQRADEFTREHAAYDLPRTNPFLRETFDYIAGTRLDDSIVWAVDLLTGILRRCDMHEVLKDFGRAKRDEDPVVHFYETFLAEYDPNLRQTRGVYYTPEPVVGYIVRSVDAILRSRFDCPDGLADSTKIDAQFGPPGKNGKRETRRVHRVQILDPAAGTGTFLYETVARIYEAIEHSAGAWGGANGYVAQHLLPRLFGFELMMAPYAVAHLKLGWLLQKTGYNFPGDERLRVYLTNTLEEAEVVAGPVLAMANEIAREANAASEVKTDCPIMVVMGNPPYSGHSANDNQWSKDLIHKKLPGTDGAPSYFECDGKPLGERNPKWLNDDYVKFIRFAQYRIERTGYGVLAFITNHGYLDNPTFRGMRQSLMHTFDEIHVLDLHGSTKKKETAPDGSKDENVFDIMQGVAICIMVRRPDRQTRQPAQAAVKHAEIWGTRKNKRKWLSQHDVENTEWAELAPQEPFYLFKLQNTALSDEYDEFSSLPDVFPVGGVGMTTARDHMVIDFEAEPLIERARIFRDSPKGNAELCSELGIPMKKGWNISKARALIRDEDDLERFVQPVLYRPFDTRLIFYHDSLVWRTVKQVMRHMLAGENLGLLTTRQTRDEWGVLATSTIAAHKSFSAYDITSLFPLYVYPDTEKVFEDTPWAEGAGGRRPNLSKEFVADFSGKLGLPFVSDGRGDLQKTFGPEDVFHYAYAVFHSPTYRARYAEFLKIDFPRLPLTSDAGLFARLCRLGAELAGLHLLESVPELRATYPQSGENTVTRTGKKAYKPPTDESPGRVYINDEQYFEHVPPEVWEFHVGGYQVCEKWLKDRKGRTLSYDDIETYRRITEALRQTIRIMGEIDASIPAWPLP